MLLECLFLLVRVVVFLFVCSCSRLLFLVYDIPRVFMHKLYRHLLVSHGCLSERVLLSVDVYLSCGCLCFTEKSNHEVAGICTGLGSQIDAFEGPVRLLDVANGAFGEAHRSSRQVLVAFPLPDLLLA